MLDDRTRALAEEANFAVLATLMPDGRAQTHVMWVDTDGEHLLLNTEVHRRKFANVQRDPRVTVTIIDREDPYSYAEVRGVVVGTLDGPEAREHIDRLSLKYEGRPYTGRVRSKRVILVVAPERTVHR